MESVYPELALGGRKNECARTDTVFFPISEVSKGTVSLFRPFLKRENANSLRQNLQKLAHHLINFFFYLLRNNHKTIICLKIWTFKQKFKIGAWRGG